MTHFGQIRTYDSGKGSGTIAPEGGGEPLAFGKDDLQKQAAEPRQGQRWGYDTRQAVGGKACATNLRRQEHEQMQAEQSAPPRRQAH